MVGEGTTRPLSTAAVFLRSSAWQWSLAGPGPPGCATSRAIRILCPVLVEGTGGGFATSEEFLKFEHEHAVVALSPEEVRLRLAEARGKLLDAGIDLEALPVMEALPAPSDGGS